MHRTRYLRAFTKLIPFALVLLCLPRFTARADEMTSRFAIGGARIDVTIGAGKLEISQSDLLRWVKSAAESVTAYYGRFPLPHLSLRISSFEGRGVRHGQTFATDGGLIIIRLGNATAPAELTDDWMLTHEMLHLG